MNEVKSLSHSKWECKYHIVFIPKCRRRTLYGNLRRHLGEVFHELARHKECRIEEGQSNGGSRAHADLDPARILPPTSLQCMRYPRFITASVIVAHALPSILFRLRNCGACVHNNGVCPNNY